MRTGARARWRAGWWADAERRPSQNHGPRPAGVTASLVIVHSISLPAGHYRGDAVGRLFTNALNVSRHRSFEALRDLQVSAHFVIWRDGRTTQFVDADRRAWHAGASRWRERDNCNDWSVGIELHGLEGRTFTAAQYATLARLIAALRLRYPITEVVGHEHVAPQRKRDPGEGFDWRRLARRLHLPDVRVWRPGEGEA